MTDKELILLKMKVFFQKADVMDLTEIALGLDYLTKDAWDKIASSYPSSIKIDS